MINIKENNELNVLNHSCAHLLAHAIKRLYPKALFWVGPVIEEGFYYDIDLGDEVIKEEQIDLIEKEMLKIANENIAIERIELSKEQALAKFANDPYKLDLINNMDSNSIITIYKQEDFADLCRGPHVDNTNKLKFFKLLKVSGAYFKGDSKNKMLQRIYGVCFNSKEELDKHIELMEEAKKRDHRKLGRELDLFFFKETAPGMPYWMPKGLKMFNILVDFWRNEHEKRGYQEFAGPQLNSSELWKTSGHWDHYKDDMFVLEDKDGAEQALKPMSCPNAIHMYQNSLRSYKELPLRFNDVDVIHRNEAAGALHGLLRVRMFRQDDSHNFVRKDQISEEINNILDIANIMYDVFGLKYIPTLSTRPESYLGEIEVWNQAEDDLKAVLNNKFGEGNYKINEGDGAFYGPKIDLYMEDCLGRKWQMGTIQLDFQLPERFDLSYINQEGVKTRPVIIHRTIYGSLERFIGLITEHFAGAFPIWIAPVQVNIIPINNTYHLEYANEIKKLLLDNNIRVELDDREEKLGYKMREAQTKKYPYNIILGNNERDNNTISYRCHGSEETITLTKEEFINKIKAEIINKK
jgi:threonyl-tRNA synthetase